MKYIGWAQLVLGLWVLSSPWILGFAYVNMAMWSNVLMGVSIAILSLWELFGENTED